MSPVVITYTPSYLYLKLSKYRGRLNIPQLHSKYKTLGTVNMPDTLYQIQCFDLNVISLYKIQGHLFYASHLYTVISNARHLYKVMSIMPDIYTMMCL